MNEEVGLLNAVFEAPDDDTPRLVYADWLQENGQEVRAEFIRTQIDLSRIAKSDLVTQEPGPPATTVLEPNPLYDRFMDRERELWLAHGQVLVRGLPGIDVNPYVRFNSCEVVVHFGPHHHISYVFRRGFAEINEGLPVGAIRPGLKVAMIRDYVYVVFPGFNIEPIAVVTSAPDATGHVTVGYKMKRIDLIEDVVPLANFTRSPHAIPTGATCTRL